MSTEQVVTSPPDAAEHRRACRRRVCDRLVIGSLLLVAAIMAIYPVVATYNNNYKAWRSAQTAVEQTNAVPAKASEERLAAAREYNANLLPSLLLDPISQNVPDGPDYQDYLSRLPGPAMATLRLPTIDTMLPIQHGTSDAVLAKGAGHVYGTHLPVGGGGTHAGISAHRGLPQMTGFDNLPDVELGDEFFIDVAGQTLAYRVTEIHTVLPNEMDRLKAREGQDLITLVTCTPYGVNSHRLLVTGERITLETADPVMAAPVGFDWTPQDWMMTRLYLTGGILLLLLVAAVAWTSSDIRRGLRNRKTRRSDQSAAPHQPTIDTSPATA